jgi:hypothetical protein
MQFRVGTETVAGPSALPATLRFGGPCFQRPDAVVNCIRRDVFTQSIDLRECDSELRKLMGRHGDQLTHPIGERFDAGVGDFVDGPLGPLTVARGPRAADQLFFREPVDAPTR